jgi:hypothetical protein
MPIASLILIAALLGATSTSQQRRYFIPTSQVVRVASMAARDEGYDPYATGMYLDELRNDGKEPIEGYTSIALYKNGQIVSSYSIRLATGDVVDPTACKLFRYPDLVKFKKETLREFGSKEASIDVIAGEVGCDKLVTVPSKAAAGVSK